MMYDFEVTESPFGKWGNLDERLQELANRLHAWYLSGDQLSELFAEAGRKMAAALDEVVLDDDVDTDVGIPAWSPKEIVLQSFEDALGDFDHILKNFPQTIEGWCENDE